MAAPDPRARLSSHDAAQAEQDGLLSVILRGPGKGPLRALHVGLAIVLLTFAVNLLAELWVAWGATEQLTDRSHSVAKLETMANSARQMIQIQLVMTVFQVFGAVLVVFGAFAVVEDEALPVTQRTFACVCAGVVLLSMLLGNWSFENPISITRG